jgi:RNA polymerase sigma-70 factor (ECF subfamily)
VTQATIEETPKAEHQLIARAISGDEDAFRELFTAHKNHVYSLCLRMTANVAEAEDLTQDCFIQVFRKLGTFRGDSALSTWIYRVAVNTALMHFRKKALKQVSLDHKPDMPGERIDLAQKDGRLTGTVDRLALARAISDLPHGYRTIFLLHDVQGYGHHEIAKILRCSVGNSKSQLHKARMRIRETLLAGKQPAETTEVRELAVEIRRSESKGRPAALDFALDDSIVPRAA